MPHNVADFRFQDEAIKSSIEDVEQDLLFLGLHSSTGVLRVQFIQGEELVGFEIVNPARRAQILSILIDAVGESLEKTRQEAAQV